MVLRCLVLWQLTPRFTFLLIPHVADPIFYAQPVLFTMCFGNELFFVSLYLMKYDHTPLSALFPPVLFSALPSSAQYYAAHISYAQWLALISAPISLGKNIVNVVQAWKASKILVGVDLAERAKERAIQIGRKR